MTDEESRDLRAEAQMLRDMLNSELGEPCNRSQSPDGSEWLEAGEPPEVVVRLDNESISVYRYQAGWDGPAHPYVRSQCLVTVFWSRMRVVETLTLLASIIDQERAARRATFGKCRYCGRINGPEHMHESDVCQSCAEKHLGVVY